jgi:hypothetical protein
MQGLRQDSGQRMRIGGWAGWLLGHLRRESRPHPRLALLERIALTPRQHLALIEADGRRFLVATGPDAAPAFHALEERSAAPRPLPRRVSW